MPASRKARAEAVAPVLDGRVRRSERSREAIVQALLDIVGEGTLQPTAQQVAERAGVGLRTVFRQFSDMEGLFAAMDARLQAEALPLLVEGQPLGRIAERAHTLVRRRASFFERIAPYKRSANLQLWRSVFLRSQHAALVRALRGDLLRWLPELETAAADLVEAFDLATCFEAWDRLRSEQGLGRSRARAATQRTVDALVAELERSKKQGRRVP